MKGTLVFCYLPFVVVVAITPQRGITLPIHLATQYTGTVVYFNSSLNPLFLLLEDHRSEASCKSNIKATILSIELVLYAFYLLIHAKLKRTFKEKSSVVTFFTVEQPRMINIIK